MTSPTQNLVSTSRCLILAALVAAMTSCASSTDAHDPNETTVGNDAPNTAAPAYVQLGEATVESDSTPDEIFDFIGTRLREYFPSARETQRTDSRVVFEFDARELTGPNEEIEVPPRATPIRLEYEVVPMPSGGVRATGCTFRPSSVNLSEYPHLSQTLVAMPLAMLWN